MPIGCSTVQRPQGGAVPFGDGWIAAVSSGAPTGACPAADAGPPKRIDVLSIGPDGSAQLMASRDVGVVENLAVAPHPDGAYVVWLERTAQGLMPKMRAVRVAAAQGIVAGPHDIVPIKASSSPVTTAMGRNLVVAWQSPTGEIVVERLDESFTSASSGALALGTFSGPTSVAASPDGTSVLEGWTNQDAP
jgi:hypothetical protein